jgi:hypothetical protein
MKTFQKVKYSLHAACLTGVNFSWVRTGLLSVSLVIPMFCLLCMSVIAVFHLDAIFFAVKGHQHPHRQRGLCCLDGEPTFSDPDGRPFPAK